jgi:hypothetical protein
MRLLFVIPHFYKQTSGMSYGSLRECCDDRARSVAKCILTLHQTFGPRRHFLHIADKTAHPVDACDRHEIKIVVCTTQGSHLLDELGLPDALYEHRPTSAAPKLLGYEAHQVMLEELGSWDYTCYLEDDLLLRDPDFFAKLKWFQAIAGPGRLLQPNRYELSPGPASHKCYVDGDLAPHVAAPFACTEPLPLLRARHMGRILHFRKAENPHSGCFFLSAEQLAHFSSQPFFMDRSTSFVGPLESAATLGILRSFSIFKPAADNAAFLEVEHPGRAFVSQLGRSIRLSEVPPLIF